MTEDHSEFIDRLKREAIPLEEMTDEDIEEYRRQEERGFSPRARFVKEGPADNLTPEDFDDERNDA